MGLRQLLIVLSVTFNNLATSCARKSLAIAHSYLKKKDQPESQSLIMLVNFLGGLKEKNKGSDKSLISKTFNPRMMIMHLRYKKKSQERFIFSMGWTTGIEPI